MLKRAFLAAALLLTALVGFAALPAHAADATITVDAASNLGSLQTQMSTNLIWNTIPDVAGDQAKLDALAPALLRIHAGDDGTTPATAPDQAKGNWDFSNLDAIVNQVRHYGGRPLLNIKFAPDWQWTCSTPDTGQTGQVRDQSYAEFGAYMARLVAYYNTGSMTDENGAVHANPAGASNRIDYWEIWNEPDGAWETPCIPPASLDPQGEALTPAQYVTMWNAVAPAMRAVDPTIKLVGPVTANPITGHTPDYVPALVSGATVQPDVISYHGYGGWQNSEPDQELLIGGNDSEGLDGIVADYDQIKAWAPGKPIWLSEGNVNSDWGVDSHQRPTNQFGVAYGASEFAQFAYKGLGLIHNYDFVDSAQYGDISDQNGAVRLAYWRDELLIHDFPVGSTLLSATNTLAPGVSALAIKKPNGDIAVLLVNRQPNSATILGGAGLPGAVSLSLANFAPASVTLQQIDASTSAATGPVVQTLPASAAQTVSFPGYGMAVLTFSGTPSGGAATPPPPPPPTVTPPPPTPSPTTTPPPPPPSGTVANGDFGTCDLSGWSFSGAAESLSSTDFHTASCGLVLGKVGATSNGASKASQTFTVPAGATTLTIWYEGHNPQINDVPYDYSQATLKNVTAGTAAVSIFKTAPQNATPSWAKKTYAVTVGDTYTLTLVNFSSNSSGDVYWTTFDDIAVS